MRKREEIKCIVAAVLSMAVMGQAVPVEAEQTINPNYYQNPVQIETTAYCDYGLTASGSMVREGVCAARRDMIGKCAIVYEMEEDGTLGDFIGYYEILDTGGDYRIENGSVIDIYIPDYDKCIEYGRRKVYVQIVEAKG